MTTVEVPGTSAVTATTPEPRRSWRTTLSSTELDTRFLGLAAALVAIWIAFHILSGGAFLTSRNLWNLSVQSTSIAIMATGMVLIIVSRNIDLSVGSLLGFLGYAMALVQTDGIFAFFGLDFTVHGITDKPYVWLIALSVRHRARGARRGHPRLRDRLRRGPCVHRHPEWVPGVARRHLPNGREAGPDARTARRPVSAPRWRCEGGTRRVAQLAGGPDRVRGHRAQHRARPPAPAATRARRAAVVGRDRAGGHRMRRRHRRRRVGGEPIRLAGDGQAHRHRLPGGDPGRRDPGDDLPRAAPKVRPIRVRVRRQPGSGRARRHQHAAHRDADLRADGRPRGRQRRRSRRPASTRRSPTSGCRTSSTSSPLPSSAALRSPAASAPSQGRCSGRSSCSHFGQAWCCSGSTRPRRTSSSAWCS